MRYLIFILFIPTLLFGETAILIPDSDVTTTGWGKSLACGDYYNCIDDDGAHDGATTQILESGVATNSIISFGLPNTVITGEIDSVVALGVFDEVGTVTSLEMRFYDGSDATYGTVWGTGDIPDTYDTLTSAVACPDGTWDQASIDNLQVGLRTTIGFGNEIRCTQLNVTVFSTVPSEGNRRRRTLLQ